MGGPVRAVSPPYVLSDQAQANRRLEKVLSKVAAMLRECTARKSGHIIIAATDQLGVG